MAYSSCPLLPVSALQTHGVMYTDDDEPKGLVSQIQRRLREVGARDEQGQLPPVTGQYDEYTAHVLSMWLSLDTQRWPGQDMIEALAGAWATDCHVYRALGIDCRALHVVPATPYQERLKVYLDQGRVSLTCGPGVAPTVPPRSRFWVALAGTVVVVFGLGRLGWLPEA